MPGYYEILLLPQHRKLGFAGSRGNYYEFEDGSHLEMHTTPVWCHRCAKITHGEEIEPLEEIERVLADLRDPSTEWGRPRPSLIPGSEGVVGSFQQVQIQEWSKRREWRLRRRTGAKCILCGSSEIFVFPINEEVQHPAGVGTVEVSIRGMCSTNFNEWFFTPEGDRIPRDTKPTYWHHPALENPPGGITQLLDELGIEYETIEDDEQA